MPRRPETTVETRDSFTQTEGDGLGVGHWADLALEDEGDGHISDAPEDEPADDPVKT